MTEPTTLLYVAGFGRNGGTLLDRTLGSIEGFESLGEFRFVWRKGIVQNELCNCGEPFRQCPFWIEVFHRSLGGMSSPTVEAMVDLYEQVDRTRYLPHLLSPWRSPGFNRRLATYVDVMGRLLLAVRDVSGARVLVDSSKFAGYGVVLSRIPGVRLHVVHLLRDSRGTAHSWAKRKVKPEIDGESVIMRRYSTVSSSLQWTYRNVTAEWLSGVAASYSRVRYEDFAEEPKRHLEQIVRQVGEEGAALPMVGERTVRLTESHTQSGNPMRFLSGDVEIRPDTAWREALGAIRRSAVTVLTLPLLHRYGYR